MKRFIATRHNGTPIITVLAKTEEEAKAEICRQLNRPGRADYLAAWQRDGEQIIERNPDN